MLFPLPGGCLICQQNLLDHKKRLCPLPLPWLYLLRLLHGLHPTFPPSKDWMPHDSDAGVRCALSALTPKDDLISLQHHLYMTAPTFLISSRDSLCLPDSYIQLPSQPFPLDVSRHLKPNESKTQLLVPRPSPAVILLRKTALCSPSGFFPKPKKSLPGLSPLSPSSTSKPPTSQSADL